MSSGILIFVYCFDIFTKSFCFFEQKDGQFCEKNIAAKP